MAPVIAGRWRWLPGEYHRRSVKKLVTFVGWNRLKYLADRAKEIGNGRDDGNGTRDEALVCTLFETGGRVSETVSARGGVSGLRKENFLVKEDEGLVAIVNQKMVKKYRKIASYKDEKTGKNRWTTEPVEDQRTYAFPIDEPLVERMLKYVENLSPGEFLFKITRVRAYQILTALDKNIWNHWFRSERAKQLAIEYGWTLDELLEFFKWENIKEARTYAGLGYRRFKFPKQVARVW